MKVFKQGEVQKWVTFQDGESRLCLGVRSVGSLIGRSNGEFFEVSSVVKEKEKKKKCVAFGSHLKRENRSVIDKVF